MRRRLVTATLLLALGGCASSWPFSDAPTLLARADRLADRHQYDAAIRAYDDFLTRFPDDPAAPRALKSRDTAASIVTARAELTRLRAELAARDAELARLRQETERLRADLEKLKDVDLNLERKKR
jgi:hypothetical protein